MFKYLIDRHKNPIGIFLRVVLYPLMGYFTWNHNVLPLIIIACIEILNILLMPPVKETYAFIEDMVDRELKWIKSKCSALKIISVILLIVGPLIIMFGLWFNMLIMIIIGFVILIIFYIFMEIIVKRNS